MRYLVTWKTLPVPPEMAKTALALLEATEAWIEEEKKAGRIIEEDFHCITPLQNLTTLLLKKFRWVTSHSSH